MIPQTSQQRTAFDLPTLNYILLTASTRPSYTLTSSYAAGLSDVVLQLVRPWVCPLPNSTYKPVVIENWAYLRMSVDHTPSCWMSIAPLVSGERITMQRLNQAGVNIQQENLYSRPSLKASLEVEEENTESSGAPMLSGQQLGPHHHPKPRRYTWFCCQCGDGPSTVKYVPACTECYHTRCCSCTVITSKA